MSQLPDKNGLLEQIERERSFWDQLQAEIGQPRMLVPGATGDWTFKDVVAHLNGWRAKTLARLDAAVHGGTPAAPPWPANIDEDKDVDLVNDWIYQANRGRSLDDVLGEYSQSFQRIRDAVAALSERDLSEVGRYSWLPDYALAQVVTDSFGHLHEEHVPVLRDWLDKLKQANA